MPHRTRRLRRVGLRRARLPLVRDLATRLGVPFKGTRAKVVPRRGESLEMAARRVRLAFFSRCMKSLKLDAIATGHHHEVFPFLIRLAARVEANYDIMAGQRLKCQRTTTIQTKVK